jgi:preprotein translocase subunit SecA
MNTIWSDFARMIYHVEVEIEGEDGAAPAELYEPGGRQAGGSSTRAGQVTYSGGVGTAQPSALAEAAAGGAAPAGYAPDGYEEVPEEVAPPVQQRRVEAAEQIGRNDPCWCGSGKKFKKCHGT